ncbi:class I SAM-dependent methyltransferase [Sphingomonas sp. dw_22]|uniref:class I SAM-dependent methyltransferase n=1 Tax=Sphingomonas sp. dw_22 TaxID=2721175 RepID=UPI001BD3C250|nr:class I SAM-dependent methyltransferase [Sphingomonas sp. dw_22]
MIRITAIMPTADRRRYVPAAITQFLAQARTDAELLILDDGVDPIGDLMPDDARIRYVREETRRAIGDKRNRACELARGEIIVHWDDDDWHAPDRLTRQIAALDETGADICGLAEIPFLAEDGSGAWDYRWGGRHRWVYGASLAYRRAWWQRRPFQPLARGEDTRFLFDARGAQVLVMPEAGWLVARVHAGNTCPKQVTGGYWHPRDPAPIQALVARWSGTAPAEPVQLLRNVHAVLVHEKPECVVDLVRNLRWHDDVSPILLYDGSADGSLIDRRLPWTRWGVEIVPGPRPMKWGALHGFALDCLRHLEGRAFDMMTIVDSDQMMLRKGYAEFLSRQLAGQSFGVLSSDPRPQRADTRIPPAQTAQAERALWQPLLDRFENGGDSFARWTFWPATVIGAEAGQAIRRLFDDPMLQNILTRSRLWATEEILFPTFSALLGFPVAQNPVAGQWTQYRRPWSVRDLDQAGNAGSAFWMHPVPRQLDHVLRRALRERCDQYRLAGPAPLPQASDEPLLATMRAVPGWLEEDEARALLAAGRSAVASAGGAAHLVEIGSYCGKATLLLGAAAREGGGRVTAIDRFDGILGSREERLHREAPSRIRFDRVIADTGLAEIVSARTGEAPATMPSEPIDLLLIDGLHDYPAVAADFAAAEPWLTPGARVLFHDYADYFPGVMALVDELVATGDWQVEAAAGTLRVLRRAPAQPVEAPRIREAAEAS